LLIIIEGYLVAVIIKRIVAHEPSNVYKEGVLQRIRVFSVFISAYWKMANRNRREKTKVFLVDWRGYFWKFRIIFIEVGVLLGLFY
jgi:hypothetical protein